MLFFFLYMCKGKTYFAEGVLYEPSTGLSAAVGKSANTRAVAE